MRRRNKSSRITSPARPRPDFVKAYMHNGYFKSLKEVVHFYNTRDTLPKCDTGSPREKVSCWPHPEVATNINTNCCNLGLSCPLFIALSTRVCFLVSTC